MKQPTVKTELNIRTAGGAALLMLPIALVLAAVLAAHWRALSAKALYFDDEQYLTQNPLVQHPSCSAAWQFVEEVTKPSTVQGYYQPLTMISLMLDTAMGGRPDYLRPYHRTSLVLHLANTGLIIIFLYLLFRQQWVAAMVGLLYGVHPLTVETIPWVGERKTLLASFFALIALVAYVRYAVAKELHTPHSALRTLPWYFVCIICYILSLMSKPTGTPLPLVLLLLDFWPLKRLGWRAAVEKLPFFLIAGTSAIITVISQRHIELLSFRPLSAGQTLLLVCHNLIFYPYHIIWPAHLSSFYAFPVDISLSNVWLLACAVVTIAMLAFLVISLRCTRALLVGWLCFFILLAPTLFNQSYSPSVAWDKYVYLPMVGLLLPLACYLSKLWNNGQRIGIMIAVMLAASAEAATTYHYHGYWRDTDTLHERAVALAPTSAIIHYNAANNLAQEGRIDEAVVLYRKTLSLDPHYAQAHNGLALLLMNQGKNQEALQHYEAALALKPDSAEAENNMGLFLLKAGKLEEAIRHCQAALQYKPDFPQAHHNLGDAFMKAGQLDDAIKHYRESVRLKPTYATDQYNLAFALTKHGEIAEAIPHYELAAQYRPGFTKAHVNLALVLNQLGRAVESIQQWQKAKELEPADAYIRCQLGGVLMRTGQTAEGVKEFREAARLATNDPEVYNQFAEALAGLGKIDDAIAQCETALKVKADYAPAHSSLGALWLAKGNVQEALSHAEKAVQISPNFVEGHINLAVVLAKQSQIDRALGEFSEALRIEPRNTTARITLGIMLQEQGKMVEAAEQFREVLKIDPVNAEAQHRLQAIETGKASAPSP